MKKKKIRVLSFLSALFLILMLCLYGCGMSGQIVGETQAEPVTIVGVQDNNGAEEGTTERISEYFTERDLNAEYDEKNSSLITLRDSSAETENDSVQITDGLVTITQEGTYILRGDYQGQIKIETDNNSKVQLVLDNVTLENAESAALYVAQADKVFVTLAEGSENYLYNKGSFAEEESNGVDGVLYSKDDLTINGTGSLQVFSKTGCGIVSNDDLKITGGIIEITSEKDGLQANDCICLTGVTLTITSQSDAIDVENTEDTSLGFLYIQDGSYTLQAKGDGISASGEILILDGVFEIQTGEGSGLEVNVFSENASPNGEGFTPEKGGQRQRGRMMGGMSQQTSEESSESQKGIKADSTITIQSGTFLLNCTDDGIHTNGNLYLNGGAFTITSDDDAIHADGMLEVNDGTYQIVGKEGLEATYVRVNGGSAQITASDDGINAGQKSKDYEVLIEINGGDISITMGAGDTDAVDSNGNIVINGGTVKISGQFAFDFDGTAELNGGTVMVNGTEIQQITNAMRNFGMR